MALQAKLSGETSEAVLMYVAVASLALSGSFKAECLAKDLLGPVLESRILRIQVRSLSKVVARHGNR